MLPFLEVSHLASSTSFYSAVIQPLGLRYTSAGSPSVTFGTATFPPVPVFELRQVTSTPARPLRPCRLILSAGSPAAVDDFLACAHRASASSASGEPWTTPALPAPGRSLAPGDTASLGSAEEAGDRRAKITDFDGNIMEVVYVPPRDYPSRFGGSTVRKTQSTHDEVTRILDWNYDVASSVPPSATATSVRGSNLALARRPGRYPDDEPYGLLRRSVTTTSMLEPTPAPSPRQNSNGLSTGAVVGTLLGVAAAGAAAGAALTYSMIKNDRAQAPLQEFEAPAFQRRSTFPEPYPDRRGRFMEVERTVEKVRYPEDYPPVAADHRPAPSYIARYSQAPTSRSQEVDDIYDDHRSRHSSRYRAPQAATVRTRSEAPLSRAPLMIADADHRSHISSKHSAAPPPSIRRSSTFDVPERESYVSARSQRTASTIRPPPVPMPVPAPSHSQLVTRSKPSSRVTTTTVKVLGNSPSQSPASRGLSRTGSYMSARNVPLPPSGVGSSHAHWDDDADSVAPSDSISCVGSRRSSRPYH